MEQDRLLLGDVGDEGRVGETLSRPQGRAVARAGFPKVVVRSKMGRHKGVPYTRPDGRPTGPIRVVPWTSTAQWVGVRPTSEKTP